MANISEVNDVSYADEKAFRKLSWLWARANNTKDWDLMRNICAPQVKLLYTGLDPSFKDEIKSPAEYVQEFSQPERVGDTRLKMQHLLGEVIFESTGSDTAQGNWQVQATHIRKLSSGAVVEWTVGTYAIHFYERVDGKWMFAGLKPQPVITERGRMQDVIGHFD